MGVSKHLFKHSYIDIGECYPWWLSGKESACSAGDADSIPESEDPLEEGINTLQYSCLENPADRGAWQAAVHRVM